jgi:hypothetical protein
VHTGSRVRLKIYEKGVLIYRGIIRKEVTGVVLQLLQESYYRSCVGLERKVTGECYLKGL